MTFEIAAQPFAIQINHSGDIRQGMKVIRSDGIEAACYRIPELLNVLEAMSDRAWWHSNQQSVTQQITRMFHTN